MPPTPPTGAVPLGGGGFPPTAPMPPMGPAPKPKARWPVVLAVTAAVAVVGAGVAYAVQRSKDDCTTAACRAAGGGAKDNLWAKYFYPAEVGFSCQDRATVSADDFEVVTDVTREVTEVDETDDGTEITLDVTTTSETISDDEYLQSDPTTDTVTYVYLLGNDGTLSLPAQTVFGSGGSAIGTVEDSVVYPPLQDLQEDGTGSTSLTVESSSEDVGDVTVEIPLELTMIDDVESELPDDVPDGDVVGIEVQFGSPTISGEGSEDIGADEQDAIDELYSQIKMRVAWVEGVGPVELESDSAFEDLYEDIGGLAGMEPPLTERLGCS